MASQKVGHDLVTEQHSVFCLQVNYGSSLPSLVVLTPPFILGHLGGTVL